MAYRVKSALATYRVAGQLIYTYKDGVLPDGVNDDDLKHLLDSEMVEEFTPEDPEGTDGPPAKSAPKAEWEAFARSRGATDADLEGATKDDLVAAYGD